jgi:hypothetical protein
MRCSHPGKRRNVRNKHRKNGAPSSWQSARDLHHIYRVRIVFSRIFAADAPFPATEKFADLQPAKNNRAAILRAKAESIRPEFARLAEEWRIDTQHLSQISKKVLHPAYFRIMGMGEPATPLLLEALRDRPAHWFAALRAITNIDPASPGSNPSAARDAWLDWGRKHGLID